MNVRKHRHRPSRYRSPGFHSNGSDARTSIRAHPKTDEPMYGAYANHPPKILHMVARLSSTWRMQANVWYWSAATTMRISGCQEEGYDVPSCSWLDIALLSNILHMNDALPPWISRYWWDSACLWYILYENIIIIGELDEMFRLWPLSQSSQWWYWIKSPLQAACH